MRKPILVFIVLFLSFFSVDIFCDEIRIDQWRPYSGIGDLINNYKGFRAVSTNYMPLLISNDNLFINANKIKFLNFQMKTDKSYLTGKLFFKRIGDKDFYMQNSYDIRTGTGNMPHRYVLNLGNNPNWYGVITQLIFSPMNSEGAFDVSSFVICEPNFWLTARSLWQELFTFEVPQLRTINFIYGPKISGKPFNLYVYCLIFFISIGFILRELIISRNISNALLNSRKNILIFCLVLWVVVDLRISFDQSRAVLLDTTTFFGKSLSEKQSLTTLGDYYEYLMFTVSRLPDKTRYALIAPSYYYYEGKADYYLYPKYMDKDAGYVLVYSPEKSQAEQVAQYINKGYRIHAKFKEGEYILKK